MLRLEDLTLNKRILVTGGHGFVGRNLVEFLRQLGFSDIITPTSSDLNLCKQADTISYFETFKPTIVLHLAGLVGGIGVNRVRQAEFFYNNAMMGLNVLDSSYRIGVEKFVGLAAGCGYPVESKYPMQETDFWNGLPDKNSLGYSMAKKNLIIHSWTLAEQFGFNSTILLPANIYGPYDNFNLDTSHVVPALLLKIHRAKVKGSPSVSIWGSGRATREFLYVQDLVKAIVASINIHSVGPYNVGTGVETSISELIVECSKIVGYEGNFTYDPDMPDGQTRRFYDMGRFSEDFGFTPDITLSHGLAETYAWCLKNQPEFSE